MTDHIITGIAVALVIVTHPWLTAIVGVCLGRSTI
jgi:hypothetical protein